MRYSRHGRSLIEGSAVAALIIGAAALTATFEAGAQTPAFTRLSAEPLELPIAAGRVEGHPGSMRIVESSCPALPQEQLRERIVDIVLKEWALFGHTVIDQTAEESRSRDRRAWRARWPRSWLDAEESERVAGSIAGYWSITADGAWIIERQNAIWRGSDGVAARWRDPWSAAFISWVMCEAGLNEHQFKRAIAHHVYIDQAIQARDEESAEAAFVAYDVGEAVIEPGDMLCSARRSAYGSIADRRRALGVGVRSHCDIVIEVDPGNDRVLAIGGNVRGAVRLKLLPAEFGDLERTAASAQTVASTQTAASAQTIASEQAAPSGATAARSVQPPVLSVGRGGRTVFAHLKLRAEPIAANAFPTSVAELGAMAAR